MDQRVSTKLSSVVVVVFVACHTFFLPVACNFAVVKVLYYYLLCEGSSPLFQGFCIPMHTLISMD
jgi:hypothetical protein